MIAQKDFSMLSDQQLAQAMQFAQRSNNTVEFIGLMTEAEKRKKIRNEQQGMQAGAQLAQGPKTAADAVMAGIANLSAPSDERGYANGGIVSFSAGSGPDGVESDEARNPLAFLNVGDMWDAVKRWRASGKPLAQYLGADTHTRVKPDNASGYIENAVVRDAQGPRAAAAAAESNPASYDHEGRREGQVASLDSNQTPRGVPRTDDTGGVAALIKNAVNAKVQAPGAGFTPTKADTTPTVISPEATPDAAARMTEAEKLAEKENSSIAAVYKRMAERDAKKQAALDAETGDKKGWLGFNISPAIREAMLRGGIGALTSKRTDALGGIGEGFAAAADAYKAGETRRKDAQDKLDEAADKRALAEIEAKKGNIDRSRQFMSDADTAKNNAFSQALHKAQISQEDKKLLEMARGHDLGYMQHLEQMANQLKVAGISASAHLAAAKLPTADVQIVDRMMKDPKFAETYRSLYDIKTAAKTDDALAKNWAGSAMLQLQYGNDFSKYKADMQSGKFVDAPAKGATVLPR